MNVATPLQSFILTTDHRDTATFPLSIPPRSRDLTGIALWILTLRRSPWSSKLSSFHLSAVVSMLAPRAPIAEQWEQRQSGTSGPCSAWLTHWSCLCRTSNPLLECQAVSLDESDGTEDFAVENGGVQGHDLVLLQRSILCSQSICKGDRRLQGHNLMLLQALCKSFWSGGWRAEEAWDRAPASLHSVPVETRWVRNQCWGPYERMRYLSRWEEVLVSLKQVTCFQHMVFPTWDTSCT